MKFLLTACLIGLYISSIISIKRPCNTLCPIKAALSTFNASRFEGKWYVLYRYGNLYFNDARLTCESNTYVLKDNNFAFDDLFQGRNFSRRYPKPWSRNYTIFLSNNTDGNLKISFNGTILGDYKIIDTDYETYAVIYACQVANCHFQTINESLWILSPNKSANILQTSVALNNTLRNFQSLQLSSVAQNC